jgi:histidinol-phosphatase (PHP family)
MRTDYHMHTPLCGHAVGAPREYVLAAQRAGLDEIGFSDHNPMPTQFDEWRMGPGQLPEYLALVEEARREFPD